MTITNTSVVINDGATYTNTVAVSLAISATGTVGAIIISEDPNFANVTWIAWPGSTPVSFVLTDTNSNAGATRRVYVAFSTSTADIGKLFDPTNLLGVPYNSFYVSTATATSSIILDDIGPIPIGPLIPDTSIQAGILINAGDTTTTSRVVSLNSYMLNANTMQVVESESGSTIPDSIPWIPYTPTIAGFVLSDLSGTKRVIALYQDEAGNYSSLQESTISYLPAAPDYTILLNQGYTFTYSPNLRVTVTISDPTILSTITAIWISELPNFAVRSEYASPNLPSILNAPFLYTYTVGAGNGLKTLYVRLWQTVAYNDKVASIYLDQNTPSINPESVPGGAIVLVNPATGGVATNQAQVTVAFQGVANAASVILSSDINFGGATWEPYSYIQGNFNTALPFTLDTDTQGIKFIYAKFSDYNETGTLFQAVGNVTAAYVGQIIYDTLAPIIPIVSTQIDGYFQRDGYQIDGYTRDGYFIKGYPDAIIINNGQPTVLLETVVVNGVAQFFVQLTLNAIGATQMALSTFLVNGAMPSSVAWLPYQTSYFYAVPQDAGLLTVYVQYRDAAGNNTAVYYATITVVDGEPIVPGLSGPYAILINGGAPKVASNNVTLTLNALYDPTLKMIVSESNTFANASWQPYQTHIPYSFVQNVDGTKIVYVQFQILLEGLYYRTSAVYSASIVRDTTPPALLAPAILINAGQTFTNQRTVVLSLNTDATAKMMQIFNEVDYTPTNFNNVAFIPFQPQLSWLLSVGNGQKKVYARFRDDVGNVTVFVSAAIQLNTTVPVAPIITSPAQGAVINQRVVTVSGTAEPGAVVSITVRKKG